MLTGFQQFLAICIGKTDDENDQPTDAQHGDEPQTESELTTDDNSLDDTKVAVPSTTDTEVSEHTEIEENDASSAPEEDTPPVTADESVQIHLEIDPVHTDENTGANKDDVPTESSADDVPVDAVTDLAPAAGNDTEQSLESEDSVPEVETEPPVEIVLSTTESEDNSQTKEIEVQEPDPPKPTIPLNLGIVEEIYDFVEMFEHSTVSGAEQAAANSTDYSGGVTKPAIFEHPTPTEVAKIDYTLSLPNVDSNDKLLLHFSIGLRDGVAFDDTERQPGGVKFAIEIAHTDEPAAPERCFESSRNRIPMAGKRHRPHRLRR